jgi:hypothetical protein
MFPCIDRLQAFPTQEHRFDRFARVRDREGRGPAERPAIQEWVAVLERNKKWTDPIALS